MKFIPGIELNECFYNEVVSNLLKRAFNNINHSAALIGYGSDVLGYDNHTSTDHNWGPRLQIFLNNEDYDQYGEKLNEYFKYNLPFKFKDFSVNYTNPRYDHTQSMQLTDNYPINHLIEITTIESYLRRHIGISRIENINTADWININDQNLLEITSGKVFHDGLNYLCKVREKLSFYPDDIWFYHLAKLWKNIQDEEPFIGRSIELKNYLGVKLISARLVENCIKICFYLEKRYIPYSKWFIAAFKTLNNYNVIELIAKDILSQNKQKAIEDKLCILYTKLIELHNKVQGLPLIKNETRYFFNRPYKVIFAETIVNLFKDNILDNEIKKRI